MFLLDEHIPRAVARGLALREPAIQVFILGLSVAPSLHASDPELLIWIEKHACLLVTNNRASMPTHLQDHLQHGRHVPGIFIIPRRTTPGEIIDELYLIWGTSLPNEFQDQIVYLPISR